MLTGTKTSRLCKGYLTKKESDSLLPQKTWPPQSPDLNTFELVWDKLDRRVKEKQPTSAQTFDWYCICVCGINMHVYVYCACPCVCVVESV